jgi:hypothetical protein
MLSRADELATGTTAPQVHRVKVGKRVLTVKDGSG